MAWRRSMVLPFFLTIVLSLNGTERVMHMVAEIHPLGMADFEAAERIAQNMLSPEGKLVSDKPHNRLILYDYPEKQDALRKALRGVAPSTQHVRLRVAVVENSSAPKEAVASQNPSPEVESAALPSAPAPILQQELLIISGGKGRIRMGIEMPHADWIWKYGLKHGFWSGPEKWKDVTAQILIEPYVLSGQRIRIRLTPEFTYLQGTQSIIAAVDEAATEIIASSAQAIRLGSADSSNPEFYSKFLTGANPHGEPRALQIILEPSID